MARVRPARQAALWVATLALLVVAEACGPAPEASLIRVSRPATLVGTTWRLVAAGGVAVPAGTSASLAFGPADLSGDSTCNAFGGTYAYEPATGALRVDGLVSTERACLDPRFNGVESAFLAALRGASAASMDPDGRLVLSGAGGELTLEVGPTRDRPGVTVAPSDVPALLRRAVPDASDPVGGRPWAWP